MKHYSLSSKKINIDFNKYYEYLSPNYIFLKMYPGSINNIEVNKNVFREELVLENTNFNQYSNVSGIIKGKKEFGNYLNQLAPYLVIENDYKEKYSKNKNINKKFKDYKKIDIINDLNTYPIRSLLKIKRFLIDHEIISNIVVIGFDDCLYNYTNYYYLNQETLKVFDAIDQISQILDLKDINLLIKSTSQNAINSLNSFNGSYPNIKLKYLPDIYPLSNEIVLKQYANSYIDNNSLIITIRELIVLYDLLYRRKVETEKVISITNLVTNEVYFCHTKLNVILKNIIKDYQENYVFYLNNPLNTNYVNPDATIIDEDVNAIIIDKEIITVADECVNCGKCLEVCPLNLSNLTKDPACIKCNLCSYMCPSNRNLLEGKNE